MELRQLRYLIKAAQTLNFSQASKELFITQSTLSQQIHQLEKELGLLLFQRNSHEMTLTEAGEELLPYARRTVNSADTCIDRIVDLRKLLCGNLNIGVTYSFSSIMTDTLIEFMRKYPKVKLNICYSTMEDLMLKLQAHELDFVLAFKPTRRYDKIESHVLFNNRLAVIVKDNHTLAKEQKITLEDLQRYDLALPAGGLQARNALEFMLSRKDFDYNVRIELNDVNILLKLIRETNYVTVLSESTIHNELGLKSIPIDSPYADMEGCIHILKGAYIKNSAQEFIRLLSQSTAIWQNSSLADLIS
jgi:LysR family cyn operon transcriptional activator